MGRTTTLLLAVFGLFGTEVLAQPAAECSRGSAVAAMGARSAGMGALIGALIKKDAWTPVALDALGPATARAAASGTTLRVVPGGVALAWSVGF